MEEKEEWRHIRSSVIINLIYDQRGSSLNTIHILSDLVVNLFHPVIPFIRLVLLLQHTHSIIPQLLGLGAIQWRTVTTQWTISFIAISIVQMLCKDFLFLSFLSPPWVVVIADL